MDKALQEKILELRKKIAETWNITPTPTPTPTPTEIPVEEPTPTPAPVPTEEPITEPTPSELFKMLKGYHTAKMSGTPYPGVGWRPDMKPEKDYSKPIRPSSDEPDDRPIPTVDRRQGGGDRTLPPENNEPTQMDAERGESIRRNYDPTMHSPIPGEDIQPIEAQRKQIARDLAGDTLERMAFFYPDIQPGSTEYQMYADSTRDTEDPFEMFNIVYGVRLAPQAIADIYRISKKLITTGINLGKTGMEKLIKVFGKEGVTPEGVPMPIPTPDLIDQTLSMYKAGDGPGEARRKMEELAEKNAALEKLKQSSLTEQEKAKLARIQKNNKAKQKEWKQDLGEPVEIKYDFPTEEDDIVLQKYPKDRTGEKGLYKIIGNTEPKWNTVKDLDLGLDKINPEADNILNSIASKEPVLVDGAYNSLITKLPSGVEYPTVQTHYIMGHKGIPFTVVDHYGFASDRGWKHSSGITNDAFIVGNGFTKATVYGNHLAIMGKDVSDIKAIQLFLTKPPKVK